MVHIPFMGYVYPIEELECIWVVYYGPFGTEASYAAAGMAGLGVVRGIQVVVFVVHPRGSNPSAQALSSVEAVLDR